MEEPQRIDLTYITERIITIFCPAECPEQIYLQNLQEIIVMLQSKHGHNYMVRWVEQTAKVVKVKVAVPRCRNTLLRQVKFIHSKFYLSDKHIGKVPKLAT